MRLKLIGNLGEAQVIKMQAIYLLQLRSSGVSLKF